MSFFKKIEALVKQIEEEKTFMDVRYSITSLHNAVKVTITFYISKNGNPIESALTNRPTKVCNDCGYVWKAIKKEPTRCPKCWSPNTEMR